MSFKTLRLQSAPYSRELTCCCTDLLLPGGEHGALSKHPKPGVKQINFGLMDFAVERTDVDMMAKLFEAGLWRPHVDPRSPFTLEQVGQAFSLSSTGTVVGKVAVVPGPPSERRPA